MTRAQWSFNRFNAENNKKAQLVQNVAVRLWIILLSYAKLITCLLTGFKILLILLLKLFMTRLHIPFSRAADCFFILLSNYRRLCLWYQSA